MQFSSSKRKRMPSVIIISLIDVLIVVLIFLMVTTTYRDHPAVKLALPESKQSQPGTTPDKPLILTIPKQPPYFLGREEVTLDRLEAKLAEAVAQNPQAVLAIRADAQAPFGTIVKVMDAAKAAKIKSVNAFTKNGVEPE